MLEVLLLATTATFHRKHLPCAQELLQTSEHRLFVHRVVDIELQKRGLDVNVGGAFFRCESREKNKVCVGGEISALRA